MRRSRWPRCGRPRRLPLWRSNVYGAAPFAGSRCRASNLGPPWFPSPYRSKRPCTFRGSFPALITPMKNGKVDEQAFRKFVNWQIEQGTPWPGARRHHRRKPDADAGGTQARDRDLHRGGAGRVPVIAGTGSNSTDEAIEYTDPRQGGGGRCGACRRSLLQQADAGRPLCPFQGHCRCGRHSDLRLQRAGPHGGQHLGRDAGQAVARLQEHHRHQGCLRRPDAAVAPAAGVGQGLHPALGRGWHGAWLQRPWRRRLHLGDRQCGAAPLRANSRRRR